MKIGKFLKALVDWLFVPHGFYRYAGALSGTGQYVAQLKAENTIFRGKLRQYKCKNCGRMFWAWRKNDTCSRLKCFFGYRMR
jgi:hypothetical protein